jgi:hypothetical protein
VGGFSGEGETEVERGLGVWYRRLFEPLKDASECIIILDPTTRDRNGIIPSLLCNSGYRYIPQSNTYLFIS